MAQPTLCPKPPNIDLTNLALARQILSILAGIASGWRPPQASLLASFKQYLHCCLHWPDIVPAMAHRHLSVAAALNFIAGQEFEGPGIRHESHDITKP